MYTAVKSILKSLLPKNFIVNNETLLRSFLVPFYKGNNHQCNVCETKLKKFVELENGDLLCPICGSLPRSRRLFKLLKNDFLKTGMKVLEFSPLRIFYRKLKAMSSIEYFASDYDDEFIADYHFDLRKMEVEDEKFDVIICYHVLEHIVEDFLAMKELYRVLKKNGGVVLVQTPFKEGEIYEDETIVSAAERTKHFGQHNHVRIYSVDGLNERLKNAGFKTEIGKFEKDEYYGFTNMETIIYCYK